LHKKERNEMEVPNPNPSANKEDTPKEEVKAAKAAPFIMKCPSSWHIQPDGSGKDGMIEAMCHETGEHFVGSVAEFNKRLRG
jgi:hypothetical protein